VTIPILPLRDTVTGKVTTPAFDIVDEVLRRFPMKRS
jgi:hypothetical protein